MGEKCEMLHSWFDILKRHTYGTDYSAHIPKKGIYIMFEKGEKGHSADRIVRIGTHTGGKARFPLAQRLNEHISTNGRSVFRRKVGAAIINRSRIEGSTFWSEEDLLDWSKSWGKGVPRQRERFIARGRSIQFEEADKLVSKYVHENISFACIEIEDKDSRKRFEARLISTVSNCSECQKSEHWFGNFSPKEKVRKSGLWQESELWKDNFGDAEFSEFEHIVETSRKKYG